jgi:hypothetical protein
MPSAGGNLMTPTKDEIKIDFSSQLWVEGRTVDIIDYLGGASFVNHLVSHTVGSKI